MTMLSRPRRLGVISNPLSGANRRRGLADIHRLLAQNPGIRYREVCTAADVASALHEFARTGVDTVAINSGDGTVQAALTSLFVDRPFPSFPLLALLPGGTTNMTSQDLGIVGSRLSGLQRLVGWARHGQGGAEILRRPVLRVDNSSHPGPLYGMFIGAAGIYNGIRFFHSRVSRLGLGWGPSHLFIFFRFLLALARRDDALVAPVSMTIRTERADIASRGYWMVLITTLRRVMLGLRPFWNRDGSPLQLAALGARPRHLLRALPPLLRGQRCRWATLANGYLSLPAHEIRLHMCGGFAIDGELFEADAAQGPLLIRDGGPVEFVRI
ncbi:MAG: diacylglycerol kinase family protein [Desulfobacterales bacterium]